MPICPGQFIAAMSWHPTGEQAVLNCASETLVLVDAAAGTERDLTPLLAPLSGTPENPLTFLWES